MARVRLPARPEMVHENPVLAPLLVALLRESAKSIEASSQRGADGNMPVGAASSKAMASIISTWADQIEASHRPEIESEPDDSAKPYGGESDPTDF